MIPQCLRICTIPGLALQKEAAVRNDAVRVNSEDGSFVDAKASPVSGICSW